MRLQIAPASGVPSSAYETAFIGSGGRVLRTETGISPSYALVGDEGYVRATITGPNGAQAWVQPAFDMSGFRIMTKV